MTKLISNVSDQNELRIERGDYGFFGTAANEAYFPLSGKVYSDLSNGEFWGAA